ncbi:MAG: beta-ketoacyl-[acyl-carrier-protein] synthase family protein [Phycisphaera sp.]|nr:beta-ketoacyl-[acyl-carrier-protein] synthase family protein [Phycisphaera sp.]
MSRQVVITGLGTISGLGIGVEALWDGLTSGRSAIDRVRAFDPSGFDAQIAAEVDAEFKVNQFVPKSYRKATKVMARDIGLAVAAADQAVRDAGLITPGVDAAQERTYPGNRTGCHIGAGLIAADITELTEAMSHATDASGAFDIHKWGESGMEQLTPLWLLKYLPNMLACHVTIVHEAQGPSNTITCGEASSGLSIGESLRVIQRGAADMCFCGGAESKLNEMAFYRQQLMDRLNTSSNDTPAAAVKPYDTHAAGTAMGEGGGIVTLEALDTATARGAKAYAELVGFGASHTVYPQGNGLVPDPAGKGIAAAIRAALRDADLTPGDIDVVVPSGAAIPEWDTADVAALSTVFGDALADVPLWTSKPFVGNCGAGSGALDVAAAAMMLHKQTLPARINCDAPREGVNAATAPSASRDINHVLVFTTSLGGQNVALILKRA